MEEILYYSSLFNIYQNLLTENNKKIFAYYYDENLSLQEIADLLHVSKSFVGNSLKKVEKRLKDLESKLHIYEKYQKLALALNYNDLEKIKAVINDTLN